jgi:CRP-like cAMP-binding protein
VLIRRLENIFILSEDEKAAFETVPMQVMDIRTDQDIVREGDRPSQCCLILEGFAAAHKLRPNGKRQIMAFYLPGDIPDLQSLHIEVMDMNLSTMARSKVAFIQHPHIRDLCHSYPRLGDVFWRETLIDASVFREWMLCIGRRSATQHMAHIFCEFLLRLKAIGLAEDNSFAFPITQGELGDALGLSTVHVNRVVQGLREKKLIAWERSTVTILDAEGLAALGEFDPRYLHLSLKKAA